MKTTNFFRFSVASLLLVGSGYSAPSYAQTEPPAAPAASSTEAAGNDAGQRYARGLELYKEGDFPQALIEMKRAYQLAPNYRVLFNIGQIYFQLGEYAEAFRTLEKYLAEGGADIPADKRESVKQDIEKLRVRVGKLEVVTKTAGAEVTIDDVRFGVTPLVDTLVTAGRRRVSVTFGGKTIARIVEVAGGETAKLEIDFTDTTVAPTTTTAGGGDNPPGVPTSGSSPVWIPWVATGALAIGAGVMAGLSVSASNDLKTKRETFPVSQKELEDASSQVKTLAAVTDVFAVAAIVGLGISIGVTVAQSRSKSPTSAVQMTTPWEGRQRNTTQPGVSVHLRASPNGFVLNGAF